MELELFSNFILTPDSGKITAQFRNRRIIYFLAAIEYIRQLPYGRTSKRSNYTLVIPEGLGTCSTKHALIAKLAEEQGIELILVCGIFEMNGSNTPGVGVVLNQYRIENILEAHCFLRISDKILDITNIQVSADTGPRQTFLYEKRISPDQIGQYKEILHRSFLKKWLVSTNLDQSFTLDQMWEIREKCTSALSKKQQTLTLLIWDDKKITKTDKNKL